MPMNDEYDVIVYGTIALDSIWRVNQLAPLNGYEHILEERKMIGGEAANTAIALTRWGVRVALLGNALGDDADGELLRSLFVRDAPNLDLRFLRYLPDTRTPYCVCIATPDGNRTMYGTGFDAMQCAPLPLELARNARFFTMEPNAWQAGYDACLVAAQAGMRIIPMDYTRAPEINVISEVMLTSRDHVGPEKTAGELAEIAAHLRTAYLRAAIITAGEEGCFVASAQKDAPAQHVPAYRVEAMVDATGAGDVFRAGILYGLLQEWDLLTAARFASAAAALNCDAMGGWGGVRSVEEILAFQARSTENAI